MLPQLEGKRVLDLACGTGRWLAWLLDGGRISAVGADSSGAMLAEANKKPGLGGRLVAADCSFLPFRDGVFDLVVCSFAMGHIPDVLRVAREVARVTATSADVYVSDLHPQAHARGWRTGFHDGQGSFEITTWPRSGQELLADLTRGGFDCVQSVECRFTEVERPIFARAGKARQFEEACHVPAVLLCHLRRRAC
jgi:malonyl-CoA O-methyltransferase